MDANDSQDDVPKPGAGDANPPPQNQPVEPWFRDDEPPRVKRAYSEMSIFFAWLTFFILSWIGTLAVVAAYGVYLGVTGALATPEQIDASGPWFEFLGLLAWIPISLAMFALSVKLFLPKPQQ